MRDTRRVEISFIYSEELSKRDDKEKVMVHMKSKENHSHRIFSAVMLHSSGPEKTAVQKCRSAMLRARTRHKTLWMVDTKKTLHRQKLLDLEVDLVKPMKLRDAKLWLEQF